MQQIHKWKQNQNLQLVMALVRHATVTIKSLITNYFSLITKINELHKTPHWLL